jgi:hypothetical protein
LLAAEIVLSAADAKLIALVPRVNGFRYVDDYEFGTQTYAQAEELLATLQEVLKEYELELNFDKTKIVPLPIPLDSSWVSELGNFEFGASPGRERRDLVHYFTRAVELAHLNQTDFVLKYSIARLRSVDLFPSNWILVQEFLLQCVMVESGTFRPVLEQLMHAKYHGMPVDKALLGEAMDFCIIQHSRTGHGSEVAWALWALVVWSVPLSQEATRAVSRMEDPVVALLALDAETRGLTPGGLDKTTWQSFMTAGDLLDRQWLLAYEANVKGWLPTVGGGDHVAAHPAFGVLKQAGVSFYDPALLLTYVPSPRPRAGIRYAPYSLVQVEG